MYGTIFNLKVKPGHEQDLLEVTGGEPPKGMVAWFLMKPDEENTNLIGIAVFENKKAHLDNANSPEQHKIFTKMMEHLISEPTWTDGEYIAGEIA
tara:strand:- start:146 stop:430 length:285 start_codon:yes stop_codon:yes gene_type:complete